MKLKVDEEKCTGCRYCELVCALEHGGTLGSEQSLIWVERPSLKVDIPIVCRQCDDPECIAACPEDALRKLEDESIQVDEEKCTGCGDCVKACPYDAIRIPTTKEVAVVCDLCKEKEPLCMNYCPVDAIKVEK